MSEQVVYVYGIVSGAGALDVSAAPRGLDAARVSVEREGGLGALVSYLDAVTYAGGTAEARAGEVAWIGPRAVAHDAVLTWASEAGVIPLPMFTLFSDAAQVRAMLRERREAFDALLARVTPAQEYTLRVFRLDAVLRQVLAARSPRIAELEGQMAAATPGQRYLLERKLEGERRGELRRLGEVVASETYEALAARAEDAVRDPLSAAPSDEGAGRAVLNASFLVRRAKVDEFRAAVTAVVQEYEPDGFRFEFTGPWPPYHFVRERASQ
jgi:hypothetical protein